MTASTAFQLRVEDGANNVYMTRYKGREIPRDLQRVVFTHKTRDRAQVMCDALNNGLLVRVSMAAATALAKRPAA
jgi:hypothetical protein